jgi:hypothetical protein
MTRRQLSRQLNICKQLHFHMIQSSWTEIYNRQYVKVKRYKFNIWLYTRYLFQLQCWHLIICEEPCVSVFCMRTSKTAQFIVVYILKIQHASNSNVSCPVSIDVELFLCLIYWLYFNYLFILLCQVSLVKDICDRCNWYNNIMSPLHNLSKYTF